MRVTLLVNPDTWQVQTVKVDEMSHALCLLDAFHLTFTSGKHLFMLEPASVTTAEAHTCIAPLGRRISLEWCIWWLQQHVASSSVASSLTCLGWSVWPLPSLRARSGVARKWPSGQIVVWSTSASNARSV